ncbi:MAG: FkbM family methyltransferase [Salibacteraceae bacterium]
MLKETVRKVLKRFNIGILPYHYYQAFRALEEDVEDLLAMPTEKLEQLVPLLPKSKAQLRQDLYVLLQLDFKREGYFVEFGATNGQVLSNTHLLEKEFGWTGILAEPARSWHGELRENRNCHIETDCVWRETGASLEFMESKDKEFSTISDFQGTGEHKRARQDSVTYEVKTISLNDLLDKYYAPATMDYLSIDTEGSEYEILAHLDHDRYRFRVITCEHAFTDTREKIYDLLTSKGYKRQHLGFSKWDDWFVLEG